VVGHDAAPEFCAKPKGGKTRRAVTDELSTSNTWRVIQNALKKLQCINALVVVDATGITHTLHHITSPDIVLTLQSTYSQTASVVNEENRVKL
jgi:hypothetical protein